MSLSSRTSITLAALLTLVVTLVMVALALAPPRLDVAFAPPADDALPGLRVAVAGPAGANAGRLQEGDVITAFLLPGERIVATAALLVEEPDTLPDYRQYNRFLREQGALASALEEGALAVELADGRQVALASREGAVADLPLLFWFQLFVGAAGVMTGVIALALGEKSMATRLYALTGLGYLIFAPAAAVYSTRELALDGSVFRALSVVNHFGALFFTASLTALLWIYPCRLSRFPMVATSYAAAAACWLLDTFQVMDTPMIFHLGVLGIFLTSLVFAGGQWLRTRGQPADRAALRWFLLSIYLATGLFAGTVIVPAAFNLPLPASQGVMFGAFLIMYWGMALGVVRYRLFRLEEWWHSVWSWFLGGVAVVVLDIALFGALDMEAGMALTLAVAAVGWLYFPLRQWLWEKLDRAPSRRMQDWLPAALPLLIQLPEGDDRERQLRERWPALLATVFAPLGVESATSGDGATPGPRIEDDGLALRVPPVDAETAPLLLRHADGGQRLFTRRDIVTLAALRLLYELARDLLRAHEAGAGAERARIARDIHDDLGALLLSLLYRSREEDQPLVRDAIVRTRELVNTLNLTPMGLPQALLRWRTELRDRLAPAGIALAWQVDGGVERVVLSARQYANLTRILREAVTNALKHAHPRQIALQLSVSAGTLRLSLRDDGPGLRDGEAGQGGRGLAIMRARAEELGGTVSWHAVRPPGAAVDEENGATHSGCEVRVRLPLARASGVAPGAGTASEAAFSSEAPATDVGPLAATGPALDASALPAREVRP